MSELDQWINSADSGGSRNSMVFIPGDGVQTSFEFNFSGGYISPDHVRAYIYRGATGLTEDIAPVLTGPNTILVEPAVPDGDFVVVYRDTPKDVPLVDFVTGAVMNEENLDKVTQQAVFAAAEMVDRFSEIKSSSDDAIVRSAQALQTANEAKDDAEEALTASAAAVSTANTANTKADSAVSTANSAHSVATGIDGKAQTALDNSAAAVSTAGDADTKADAAVATANGIDSKAQTALDNSAAAVDDAEDAITLAQSFQSQIDATSAQYYGNTDPTTITGLTVGPGFVWAHKTPSLRKRRNDANDDWVVEGVLFENNSTGRLLNVQIFTSSGTYTPTPGAKTGIARGVGGGGAGGGCPQAGGVTNGSAGGGGSAGAWGVKRFDINFTSLPITIGSEGAGASAAAGGNGGTTSLGSLMSLPGGNGGKVSPVRSFSNPDIVPIYGGLAGDMSESPTGADYGSRGEQGDTGFVISSVFDGVVQGGRGGSSPFGSGGSPRLSAGTSAASGFSGSGYGAGGGGGGAVNNGAAPAGGAGTPGVLIIYEYA